MQQFENEWITTVKRELEEKRDILAKRVDALESDKRRERGAISADFGEQAVDTENDEVIDRLEKIELNEIKNIQVALKRIEKGTYGKCAVCGEDIALKRLQALPFAVTCIECNNLS